MSYKYLPTKIKYARGTKRLSKAQLQALDDSIGRSVKTLEQMKSDSIKVVV